MINQVLSEDGLLDQHDEDQIIIRISNGNKRHIGMCNDPPILRTLEFKLVANCTCPGAEYSDVKTFSNCVGLCDGNSRTAVLAIIFSESGALESPDIVLSLVDLLIGLTLTIPMELEIGKDATYDSTWLIQKGNRPRPRPRVAQKFESRTKLDRELSITAPALQEKPFFRV